MLNQHGVCCPPAINSHPSCCSSINTNPKVTTEDADQLGDPGVPPHTWAGAALSLALSRDLRNWDRGTRVFGSQQIILGDVVPRGWGGRAHQGALADR